MKIINVIGAGLAGSEAANYLANHGFKVNLFEMRPSDKAPAHHTSNCAELVCSNSLKSSSKENAAGVLKYEMEVLDSLVMESAKINQVPAGQALAVDRELFSKYIDEKIRNNKNINFINEEFSTFKDDEIYIVASGPLTSDSLSNELAKIFNKQHLYFYDAAAPLVLKNSIDFSKAYYKSRYDKGDSKDYINCPFTEEEFNNFYFELIKGERVKLKNFEKEIHFEGCMPIESIATRGPKTLLFGPMKPVGLNNGSNPKAVVQLRCDNKMADVYNIVGFQTNLLFKEQERIFRMIPGLENAQFVKFGVMHRNTYINAPEIINNFLQVKNHKNIFICGQLCGVEGYIESAMTGIIAAINASLYSQNKDLIEIPTNTVIGSLLMYISTAKSLQPMNANYGVVLSDTSDKLKFYENSIASLKEWKKKVCL